MSTPAEIAEGLTDWERAELLRTRERSVTHCGLVRFMELVLEELGPRGYEITPLGREVAAELARFSTEVKP